MDFREHLANAIVSGIRTAVAGLVGLIITWLVASNITFPENTEAFLTTLLFAVAIALYNGGINLLAQHVNPKFGWFLLVPKTPEYNAVAVELKDGQTVAGVNSALPTGEIVTVTATDKYDPAKTETEPHPYE